MSRETNAHDVTQSDAPVQWPGCVLVGGDHVGKTTLLDEVARHGAWRVVALDAPHLVAGYEVLTDLRRALDRVFVERIACSPHVLLSALQLPVMYLRQQLAEQRLRAPVLVDSYYYKVLAKCLLKKLVVPEILALWRQLPPPSELLLLRADPELLWQRSGCGTALNPFEYYGAAPSRDGFVRFQEDLVATMLAEARGIPVHVIDASGSAQQTARATSVCLSELRDRSLRSAHA